MVDGVGRFEDQLGDSNNGVAVVDEAENGRQCLRRVQRGVVEQDNAPAAPWTSPACISCPRHSPSSRGSPYRQGLEAVAAQRIAGLMAMRIRQKFDLQTGRLGCFRRGRGQNRVGVRGVGGG